MFRQMAAGDLQREVAPRENARDGSCLWWIEVKVLANMNPAD